MYAHTDSTTAPSLLPSAARPTRATLQTRPMTQRALIRSWEYIRPVRAGVLAARLLVALWLTFLGVLLMSQGYVWGWTLLLGAVIVAEIGFWVFTTARKGWPAAEA
jgi:uncharacterized sodium:solute symporter family permease YidK